VSRDQLVDALVAARAASGLSVAAIAQRSGYTERHVRRVFSGDTAKLEVVDAVAGVFGLELGLVPRGGR
jgi:predicted transcriptional regulator